MGKLLLSIMQASFFLWFTCVFRLAFALRSVRIASSSLYSWDRSTSRKVLPDDAMRTEMIPN